MISPSNMETEELRDVMAAFALQGLTAHYALLNHSKADLAKEAYELADEMLKARVKEEEKEV